MDVQMYYCHNSVKGLYVIGVLLMNLDELQLVCNIQQG